MIIQNKKAYHDFVITDTLEAGIVLSGAEVKSVRAGSVSLTDSFVRISNKAVWLHNAHISPYQKALNFDPRRNRLLLLHRNEIEHLKGKIRGANLTLVPTKMYTNKNLVKLEIGLARGKKQFEKREDLKRKAIERDIETSLRETKLRSRKP